MKILCGICLLSITIFCNAQQPAARNTNPKPIDTTSLDLKKFTASIYGDENDSFEQARKLLYWLSSNFKWTATDYKSRTVNEIIFRQGGNCFELAKVYMAMINAAGIPHRGIAEINIHAYNPRRQETAASLVKKKGNRYSVFGLQHNDHRWVEIYNSKSNNWEPADPSIGVIGINDWLEARVWFGERKTIDTSFTNQMIVPFAIFVTGNDKSPVESRSAWYLIDQFNALYGGKLVDLPEWQDWIKGVNALNLPSMNAFLGKEDLHQYQENISRLATAYERLKNSWLRSTSVKQN